MNQHNLYLTNNREWTLIKGVKPSGIDDMQNYPHIWEMYAYFLKNFINYIHQLQSRRN